MHTDSTLTSLTSQDISILAKTVIRHTLDLSARSRKSATRLRAKRSSRGEHRDLRAQQVPDGGRGGGVRRRDGHLELEEAAGVDLDAHQHRNLSKRARLDSAPGARIKRTGRGER